MAFKHAEKSQQKLRLAIFGPSGAGKTMTALRVASGISKPDKIALIDTEHGSASKYADRYTFDTDELLVPNIENMVKELDEAAKAGYEVVIIDSLSHAWQELLDEMDRLAKASRSGNSFSVWREGTPKQRLLVKALLEYPGHIIATMRSKTEWVIEQGDNGKSKPVRKGLSPEQGKGIEYEFDMLMEIGQEHYAEIIKDRTGMYQDKIIEKPGEDFGAELIKWLNTGKALHTEKEFADLKERTVELLKNKLVSEPERVKARQEYAAIPKTNYGKLEEFAAYWDTLIKSRTVENERSA